MGVLVGVLGRRTGCTLCYQLCGSAGGRRFPPPPPLVHNRYRFGEGLELPEQQWLVAEINAQLQEVQVGPGEVNEI